MNKSKLYESIMKNIAKEVKKVLLNENAKYIDSKNTIVDLRDFESFNEDELSKYCRLEYTLDYLGYCLENSIYIPNPEKVIYEFAKKFLTKETLLDGLVLTRCLGTANAVCEFIGKDNKDDNILRVREYCGLTHVCLEYNIYYDELLDNFAKALTKSSPNTPFFRRTTEEEFEESYDEGKNHIDPDEGIEDDTWMYDTTDNVIKM